MASPASDPDRFAALNRRETKMRIIVLTAVGLSLTLVAGCVPRPSAPPPAPLPAPQPRPEPAPPSPPPAPAPTNWQDAPLSLGEWSYSEGRSIAFFGPPGASFLSLGCDNGRITLSSFGGGDSLTVTTTFGVRTFRAESRGPTAVATLSPNDPLLDQIAFSRGRFMVQGLGAPAFIVPSWPEPARVIEDCRA